MANPWHSARSWSSRADARWRKSSYSSGSGGNCVEVATNLPGLVAVRDSKSPGGPALLLTAAQWQAFTTTLKAGVINLTAGRE